jgi:serine/arginine repetitive matrix protein 1
MSKVRLEVIKPWIAKRITELLGVEDDIVIDYAVGQLQQAKNGEMV